MMNSNHDSLVLLDDDVLVLEDDTAVSFGDQASYPKATPTPWKVAIVDDDVQVHQATKLALKNFTFEGKSLAFLSAYSGEEALNLIAANPDTAFILLDVVMESNDAGLKVVRYIREQLNNKLVRIILRTGQPGDAPEESVILDYDINDYKLKVEITRQKLITTAISAIRSYRDLLTIQQQKNQLAEALDNVEKMQLQLVQSEKMSALGNLVTGIAHEVNNPINFILGNLQPANDYIKDLFELIDLYQDKFPNPGAEVEEQIETIDLEYLREDLPKLLKSMQQGIDRIRNISVSLCTFSRADTESKIPFNIHEGIDSSIMILKHRLKANSSRPEIEVIRDYGYVDSVRCFPGQLNQVFMNLLANAIDALDESNAGRSFDEIEANPNQITIKTWMSENEKEAFISIKDNGGGISPAVKPKIFDRLFTTKAVGKGTGLGLAIAHQIVVEKHGGSIEVNSAPRQGAEFVICVPV